MNSPHALEQFISRLSTFSIPFINTCSRRLPLDEISHAGQNQLLHSWCFETVLLIYESNEMNKNFFSPFVDPLWKCGESFSVESSLHRWSRVSLKVSNRTSGRFLSTFAHPISHFSSRSTRKYVKKLPPVLVSLIKFSRPSSVNPRASLHINPGLVHQQQSPSFYKFMPLTSFKLFPDIFKPETSDKPYRRREKKPRKVLCCYHIFKSDIIETISVSFSEAAHTKCEESHNFHPVMSSLMYDMEN